MCDRMVNCAGRIRWQTRWPQRHDISDKQRFTSEVQARTGLPACWPTPRNSGPSRRVETYKSNKTERRKANGCKRVDPMGLGQATDKIACRCAAKHGCGVCSGPKSTSRNSSGTMAGIKMGATMVRISGTGPNDMQILKLQGLSNPTRLQTHRPSQFALRSHPTEVDKPASAPTAVLPNAPTPSIWSAVAPGCVRGRRCYPETSPTTAHARPS